MYAENLVINDGSQWQEIKDLSAVPPHVNRAVLPQALIVETVDLGDLSALMISSNQGNSVSVPDFQGQQEQESLNRVEASVHEVSHEDVVGLGAVSSHLEELH